MIQNMRVIMGRIKMIEIISILAVLGWIVAVIVFRKCCIKDCSECDEHEDVDDCCG